MLSVFFRFSWILIFFLPACNETARTPPEIELEAGQEIIDYNGFVEINWSAAETDYCIASGDWVGNIKRSGSKTKGPLTRDSEFILDCFYSGKQIQKSVQVKVEEPKIADVRISASPLSIAFDTDTTLRWSSDHVHDCQASGDWNGSLAEQGSMRISGLKTDSEFRIACEGDRESVQADVKVNVYEAGIEVPLVSLSAQPLLVPDRGSTTLSWSSSGADICRASGSWSGSKARNGTEVIRQVNQDSTFILSCTQAGDRGVDGMDAIEVRVDPFSRQVR